MLRIYLCVFLFQLLLISHGSAAIERSFGTYTRAEQVGRGGFAVIYRGLEVKEGLTVAFKVPMKMPGEQDRFFEFRLNLENRMNTTLSKKTAQFLRYYGIIKTRLSLAFVMEYFKGKPLPLDKKQTDLVSIVGQLANALFYMESVQIVHRDLKPDNILIDENGVLKLIDFGLARLAPNFRETGVPCGTLKYLGVTESNPPESGVHAYFSPNDDMSVVLLIVFSKIAGRPITEDPKSFFQLAKEAASTLFRGGSAEEKKRAGDVKIIENVRQIYSDITKWMVDNDGSDKAFERNIAQKYFKGQRIEPHTRELIKALSGFVRDDRNPALQSTRDRVESYEANARNLKTSLIKLGFPAPEIKLPSEIAVETR